MEFIDLKAQYQIIAERLQGRLTDVMSNSRFIMGAETAELEERLAAYVGVKHCITCANGTDALTMPLMAWDIGPGDAVFVPSFTFFATAEAVSLVGATPVFVDVEQETFNIDMDKLSASFDIVAAQDDLLPKTVIGVDLFGHPAANDEIERFAMKRGLLFLEDAAQGFGGSIGLRKACSFGDAAATSFFPAKPLGCYGDGGALFTNNDSYAESLRSIRVHGQGDNKYDNVRIGLNSRLDNLQAAILLEKLSIFDSEMERKNAVAQRYSDSLSHVLQVPLIKDGYSSSWAQYTVLASNLEERTRILEHLKTRDIPTAVYYKTPLHRQLVYTDYYRAADITVSETLASRVFSLPMHAYLSDEDIDRVISAILEVFQ